ncbi:zinc finger SWIM domain-containing protein 1 [Sceloporus undulatus]|uniref:zinc finger SWIM domain-containing protein 1 n=1 Tax=Sceloporus undulatus TaxID=8520 RepID=UPI001C4D9AE1|nr:zinc finger SWIM domain-containing protein 1 [Sceloporus undulatus]
MALDTVRKLQTLECGSLVSSRLDKHFQLESISFQTILMRDIFLNHPEVVLIHRTHSPWGKALYVFMVDKPFLKLEGEWTKIIHFAIPAKESAEELAHMYRNFKSFNPEWKQIKTFLVDPRFRLLPTLSEAFPLADVQLSVFHICKHLQHKIHQASLEFHTERLILSALRNAMCAPSESNLKKMHTILSDFVKPNLLPPVHKDWLHNDKIWAFHRWRTWQECSQYFKDLEVITHSLSQIFCVEPSLDTFVSSIAKCYQKSSTKAAPCPAPLLSQNVSPFHNILVLGSPTANSQRTLLPQDPSPAAQQENTASANGDGCSNNATGDREAEVSAKEAEWLLRQSLTDICTEPAARLCLNELAVVQSSVQLLGTNENTVNIQILEDAQVVRHRGLSTCSCHFSQTFQLPCRHILAVLNSEGKDVEPNRIPVQWRKGHGASQTEETGTDGLLEVLRSSWDGLLDKYLAVSFLTAEISRLLNQCSREEFDRRYSTLRELADSWIGPYMQVKL